MGRNSGYYPSQHPTTSLISSRIVSVDTPHSSGMLPFDTYHGVSRLSVSGDGTTFAFTGDDGSVDIWRRTSAE